MLNDSAEKRRGCFQSIGLIGHYYCLNIYVDESGHYSLSESGYHRTAAGQTATMISGGDQELGEPRTRRRPRTGQVEDFTDQVPLDFAYPGQRSLLSRYDDATIAELTRWLSGYTDTLGQVLLGPLDDRPASPGGSGAVEAGVVGHPPRHRYR
jgi:hypothetical protein